MVKEPPPLAMDNATVLSLVHSHILDSVYEYYSYVPAYYCIRRNKQGRYYRVNVGGHFRLKPLYKSLVTSLRQTCKFEIIAHKPMTAFRFARQQAVRNARQVTLRIQDSANQQQTPAEGEEEEE